MTSFLPAGVACVTVIGLWLAVRITGKRSGLPYPPGPKRLPIVGNAFDIDLKEPHVTYTEWAKIYGDIVYSRIFGQDIIIVNSEKMARLLAEQRSSIYSDRPHSPIYRLFGTHHMTPVLEYGKEWKTHRKLLHLSLRHEVIDRYQELHLRSAHRLLENIQQDRENFYNHLTLYTGSVALEFTYGRQVDEKNDPVIKMATDMADIMAKGLTSERAGLLTALPILKYIPSWFPGASFQDEARRSRDMVASFSNFSFSMAKRQAEAGVLQPSFVSDMLGQRETSSTLKTLVLAMVLNPEIQDKVHAELDAVVGKGVLPTFADRDSLPYLQAVLYEVMRWHPVFPLGVPHATTASDIVEGYCIPKGTLVIFNTWAMVNNEYSNPERFDPTRHLTADGKLKPDAKQDSSKYFGFGRRFCPGRFFADDSLWAATAVMLSAFRFEKPRDAFGKEIEIEPVFRHGVVSHPAPYQCSIISRTGCENPGS
ncbi:cytochrome P450 [Pisolithus marmoratus]|nr:cytochrome P450 [Pisolithus marmoratus]